MILFFYATIIKIMLREWKQFIVKSEQFDIISNGMQSSLDLYNFTEFMNWELKRIFFSFCVFINDGGWGFSIV